MNAIVGGYSREAFEKPLHDYQVHAHDWLIDRLYVQDKMGGGLFLDPGLGKTRITLTVLDMLFNLGAIQRALIVAPLRPIYSVWPAEIRKWGFPQTHIILHNQPVMAMAANRQIELMNYDSLKKLTGLDRWDIVVLDESTFVKNWSTKRIHYLARAKDAILRQKTKRIILTGTPAANSLADLFAQMYVVDAGESLGKTVTHFRHEYCYQGGWQGRQWVVRKASNTPIHVAIQDSVLRMSAEDYLDMPQLVENDVWVDLPAPAAAQYKRLKRELVAELSSGKVFAINASSAYTKCRQIASGQIYATDADGQRIPDSATFAGYAYHVAHREKVSALLELMEELAGKPLLVLYWYRHELTELQKNKAFSGSPAIHGDMKPKDAERIISEWNADKHPVIFCQWAAASHGLNMQEGSCADIACFCLTDSAEGYEQAYRRVYRQGVKAKQVRVHRILARDTVDEVQLERLMGKFATQSAFLAALKAHATA